jgi:hypothetical protein
LHVNDRPDDLNDVPDVSCLMLRHLKTPDLVTCD